MTPQDRREAIVCATLPLLQELGSSVTTSQIARAAGIAEGTIFRHFADKRELIDAALAKAMSADAEVARIEAISLDLPLARRLADGLAATADYQDRLWQLMRIVREAGWTPDHAHHEHGEHHPRHQMERIGDAMARLFEPDRARLRREPRTAARLLLGLAFADRIQDRGPNEPGEPREHIVDLFLYGALSHA